MERRTRTSRASADPAPILSYMVCTTPRSGGNLLCEFLRDSGIVGARIFWPSLQKLVHDLRLVSRGPDAAAGELLEEFFPGLRYVWLVRRDRIRQAVSYVRATQTGRWTSLALEKGHEPEDFDFEMIHRWAQDLSFHNRFWEESFVEHHIQPLTLLYEDLAMDPAGAAHAVMTFLNLADGQSVVFPAPQHEKQSDELKEEWVRRYQEMSRSPETFEAT